MSERTTGSIDTIGSSGATAGAGTFGTVSILRADIHDCAMLWERDRAAMQAAHSRYLDILREAIEANGGYDFQTIGDILQAAFPTAVQAAQAAIDAQLLLFTEQWPPSIGDLAVRMALHTGAIHIQEGPGGYSSYSGPTLNRAGGLLSAGHSGQMLLSAATQELVRDHLSQLKPADPPGVQLMDLGEHRLNDLSRPEHIYQLVVPALPAHFPALHSLDSLPNNLPRQSTPLIGREKQAADVIALLRRSDVSLVTLTGPAGTGKTRLSLEVGAQILEEYKDGVWLVELATLSPGDHELVPATIAETLRVREARGQAIIDTLKEYLADKQLLLVLDNFEQVTQAAPQISSLLKAAPHVKVLVSSRIALRVYGEREYRVPPLTLPDRKHLPKERAQQEQEAEQLLEQYTRCEAVRLFVDRAQAAKAGFEITAGNAPDIAAICTRLDGLPLAIELAAARVKLFTLQALLGRLSDRLKILTGGARDLPARQQTMRGAIEWSYDLLSEEEKLLFRRMAIFNGGATLEAVVAACGADSEQWDVLDGIQSLLDQSLLVEREGGDGELRYRMLETIHEYAREKLKESGEEEALAREHALYFMRLAEEAEPELKGEGQAEWLNRLEDEHDNLRAAIQWAIARAGAATGQSSTATAEGPAAEEAREAIEAEEVGLRTAGALWMFWEIHGHFNVGRLLLAGVLNVEAQTRDIPHSAFPIPHSQKAWRAKALSGAGNLADKQGDYAASRSLHEESLALRRELGDKPGIAASLNNLGLLEGRQGDYVAARSLHEESLALRRESGDKTGMSASLNNLGVVDYVLGDYPAARSRFEESLALCRELRDKTNVGGSLSNLAAVVYSLGDYPAARSLNEESLAIKRELGDKSGIAICLNNLGDVHCMLGDYPAARSLYEQSLALMKEMEDKGGITYLLHNIGNVIYSQGDYPAALSLYEQSLEMKRDLGDKDAIALSLFGVGRVAVKLRKAQRGARLLGAAEALLQTTGAVLEPVDRMLQTEGTTWARNQLGDEAFERLKADGREMSMEEAISYALQHATADEPAHVQSDEERLERERQVDELRIEINQAKKAQQVQAITGTDYFMELQARASALLLERKKREEIHAAPATPPQAGRH